MQPLRFVIVALWVALLAGCIGPPGANPPDYDTTEEQNNPAPAPFEPIPEMVVLYGGEGGQGPSGNTLMMSSARDGDWLAAAIDDPERQVIRVALREGEKPWNVTAVPTNDDVEWVQITVFRGVPFLAFKEGPATLKLLQLDNGTWHQWTLIQPQNMAGGVFVGSLGFAQSDDELLLVYDLMIGQASGTRVLRLTEEAEEPGSPLRSSSKDLSSTALFPYGTVHVSGKEITALVTSAERELTLYKGTWDGQWASHVVWSDAPEGALVPSLFRADGNLHAAVTLMPGPGGAIGGGDYSVWTTNLTKVDWRQSKIENRDFPAKGSSIESHLIAYKTSTTTSATFTWTNRNFLEIQTYNCEVQLVLNSNAQEALFKVSSSHAESTRHTIGYAPDVTRVDESVCKDLGALRP